MTSDAPESRLPGDLLQQAFAEYRAGALKLAETICHRVLKHQPRSEPAAFLAGVIAGKSGDHALCERLLRDAVTFAPRSVRAHVQLASTLRQQNRVDEAESEFREAARLDPGNPVILNDLGICHLAARRWNDAESCFNRAISLRADFALAHYNLGVALQAQSRNSEALASFQRAAAVTPALAEAHAKIGDIFEQSADYGRAIESYRLAAAARPDSTVADINLAKIELLEQQPAQAEEYVRRAIRRSPDDSEAWRLLGAALQQLGRFGEAAKSLRRCIEIQPRQIIAWYDLVQTHKMTRAETPLIGRMRDLARLPGLTLRDRASLHFALGKSLDDLGEYAEAIVHFDEANRLENSRCSFQAAAHRSFIDETIGRYTAEFLQSCSKTAHRSEKPVLILGMMRSGTTLVEQILSSHPQIGAGGELTFWGDTAIGLDHLVSGKETIPGQQKLAGKYLSLLDSLAPRAMRVTDKMPHNFLWLGLINAILPSARIIHCRRNPVDTCLSIFFTRFATAVPFAYDRSNIVAYYEEYVRLLAHWRSVLPANRFIEVDYEDVVADREAVARELITFCGLEWNDACLRHEQNKRAVTTSSVWQARQPIYTTSIERWRRYEPWLGEFRRLISEPAPRPAITHK